MFLQLDPSDPLAPGWVTNLGMDSAAGVGFQQLPIVDQVPSSVILQAPRASGSGSQLTLRASSLSAAANCYNMLTSSPVLLEMGAKLFAQNVSQFSDWIRDSARATKELIKRKSKLDFFQRIQALTNLSLAKSSDIPDESSILDSVSVLMMHGTPCTPQQQMLLRASLPTPNSNFSLSAKDAFVANTAIRVFNTVEEAYVELVRSNEDITAEIKPAALLSTGVPANVFSALASLTPADTISLASKCAGDVAAEISRQCLLAMMTTWRPLSDRSAPPIPFVRNLFDLIVSGENSYSHARIFGE